MLNGKVPDDRLDAESFTWEELREAAKASPWAIADDHHSFGFAVRWMLEWIVKNKRFAPGEFYQDAKGRVLVRRDDDLWPWLIVMDDQGRIIETGHVTEAGANLYPPLRKLVPSDA